MAEPARTTTDVDLRQWVKEILRRDLKLGPDVRIDDDMPLFNSDADLDSLDMLLLVSSIEREFGFRIPNEAVGTAIFQSVDSLTNYIEQHRGEAAAPVAGPREVVVNPLDHVPHAEPFRFVTKLNQLKAGEFVEGVWAVTGSEAFFAGHFPGNPLVPGVLIAEALAQVSGLIETSGASRQGKLAHVDVRFEQPVAPPADILLKSRLNRAVGALQQFDVSAEVKGVVVARGTIALHRSEGAAS
jgi:3-hydroxyacyl-[acyl-carrier-protein] dehydratase